MALEEDRTSNETEAAAKEAEIYGKFLALLADELNRVTDRFGFKHRSDAFTFWGVRQISPSLKDEEVKAAVVTTAPDKRVDAAWFDPTIRNVARGVTGVYFVAQAKCPESLTEVQTFGTEPADELIEALTWLRAKKERASRSELKVIRREFFEKVESQGYPARLAILVPGIASTALTELVHDTNEQLAQSGHDRITLEIFDALRLYDLYISRLETGETPIPDHVSFRIRSGPMSHLSDKAKAYICEVPLSEIHSLVKEHGLALFAKNLRVYLAESTYNKGITRVLEDGTDRENFWYYNNGLTAVCEGAETRPSDDNGEDGLNWLLATKFQIVNGCQTCMTVSETATRWEHERVPLDPLKTVSVLMRVIIIPKVDGDTGSLSRSVARYTNSQTPITFRDLHSTDPEQGRLKSVLGRDWSLFLEVKKGEWKRRLERDRSLKLSYVKPLPVSNEEMAQASAAFWRHEPVFATASKRQLFSDDTWYTSIFSEANSPESLLLPTLLWYLADDWVGYRGYRKRKVAGSGGARVTKAEVAKRGSLYSIGMAGLSLMKIWHLGKASELDEHVGKNAVRVLRNIYPDYGNPPKSLKPLGDELDNLFQSSVDMLFEFSREELTGDPDTNLRNLLIRPATWTKFKKSRAADIFDLAKLLAPMLTSPA
ncbi:MAG TPA: AIPR family protein [Thermoplasmata archaeon]|nr:AIPR family protein [Thermoplasmata archaeon]